MCMHFLYTPPTQYLTFHLISPPSLPPSLPSQVQNTASIGERKNMNLPGAIVNLPTLTEKDVADLTDFGVPQNVDFIAASFVRKGADIDYIRSVLGEQGAHIKIIAKIEVCSTSLPSLPPSLPLSFCSILCPSYRDQEG